MEFKKGVEKELELNQQVVDKILPQLVDQEVKARDKKNVDKLGKKTRKSSMNRTSIKSEQKALRTDTMHKTKQSAHARRSKSYAPMKKDPISEGRVSAEFPQLQEPEEFDGMENQDENGEELI